MTANLRDRIAAIAGLSAADQIVELLEEEAASRCSDADCLRRLPHSRLARHVWRHEPSAPLTRGLLGRKCFTCGQATWRRIHRTRRIT
ncbi:hypothetical protein [Streptomyces sp. NPDC055243]|uniref:hypothetical protein n=1 Tax=Streptomyces sp. NPDC055243 TaxID=3365720 RepID=UPI0037CFB01A